MKRIILTAVLFAAAPMTPLAAAGRLVWFHPGVWAGILNPGIDAVEYWGELDLSNRGEHAETVTMAGRRFGGKVFAWANYTLGPGEKRTIRIEDPEMRVDSADGMVPEALRGFLLIDPVPVSIFVELRQLQLHGDKLTTAVPSIKRWCAASARLEKAR